MEGRNVGWAGITGGLAAIAMVGAGIYLMSSESASSETTVFDALFDGMGVYFIARGLWVISQMVHRG